MSEQEDEDIQHGDNVESFFNDGRSMENTSNLY